MALGWAGYGPAVLADYGENVFNATGNEQVTKSPCNATDIDVVNNRVGVCSGGRIVVTLCYAVTGDCAPVQASCGGGYLTAYCPALPAGNTASRAAPEPSATSGNTNPSVPDGIRNPVSQASALDQAQTALNVQAAAANAAAVARIASAGSAAGSNGPGQGSLALAARDVNQIGANQAATMGALFCAQGAVDQAGVRPDLASQNYGTCKQYFDTANALKGPNGAYREDPSTMAGDFAKGTLEEVEKTFGITGSEFVGRLLGSGGSRDELAELTKDKLKAEAVAKAFDEAQRPASGDDKYAVALGAAGSGAGKGSTEVRSSLKAALKDAAASDGEARRPATVRGKKPEGSRMKGLEPLREGVLADAAARNADKEAREAEAARLAGLSIFDVVHLKYADLARKRDL